MTETTDTTETTEPTGPERSGAWLRRNRENMGLTQRELAERLGEYLGRPPLNVMTIWRWEKGQRTPQLRQCRAIAGVFGYDVMVVLRIMRRHEIF